MNIKKIIILALVAIIGGSSLYLSLLLFLGKNKSSLSNKSVKGISVQKQENKSLPSASNIPNSLQQKLDYIKQEVSKLDIKDIASSSPQVQKLIKDLNSLKEYPSNQAKEICEKICSSL